MSFIELIKKIFQRNNNYNSKTEKEKKNEENNIEKKQNKQEEKEEKIEVIHSLWDFLEFNENTQSFHIISVMGFDEWVTMDELRRRIIEIFKINYKNEKSLYPYIKTLVDVGLLETTNIGGRRQWRKRELLIKLKKKKNKREESEEEFEVELQSTSE